MGQDHLRSQSGESGGFSAGPRITTCFFDLDDTLYPQSTGIGVVCRGLIKDYMVSRLGFHTDTVDAENLRLYRKHGTSMAGLRAEGYDFSFDDWHDCVHVPLPYDAIRPDPVLRNVLHSLPQRKYVFTNSDRGHAARCLSRLGIEDCLHGVIAFEDIMQAPPIHAYSDRDLVEKEGGNGEGRDAVMASWQSSAGPLICCKPQAEAFKRALALVGAAPESSIMFDDSVANIVGAKNVGLSTVLVGTPSHTAAADYCVANLHNLHGAVPELWEGLEVHAAACPCGQETPLQAVQA